MYSLCLPTTDRPYRHATFHRLVETGTLEHPLVGGFHIAYHRGPNEASDHALKAAIADETSWILFLEDDIDIVDDFMGSVDRWLQDVQEPAIHLYPLGCAMRRALREARAAGQTSWRYPLKEFYGATGFAIRQEDAADFCRCYAKHPAWMMPWNGLDVNLQRWHARREPTQAYLVTPVPCLIDHLGARSTQSTDPRHFTGRYEGFAGRSWRYDRAQQEELQ